LIYFATVQRTTGEDHWVQAAERSEPSSGCDPEESQRGFQGPVASAERCLLVCISTPAKELLLLLPCQ